MKSILLIEGSTSVAKSTAQIFEERGWQVTACGDRDFAIERLAGSTLYDVVLLGYDVPGSNEVQLVKFIRTLDHRRMTAVVMVTGSSKVIEEALSAGADEVLLQPIEPTALVCVVDKHFS